VVESQLYLVLYLLWLRSWADLSPLPSSSRVAVPQTGSTTAIGESRSRVELMLHVLAERTHNKKIRQQGIVSNDESIGVASDNTHRGLPQTAKPARSLRKIQSEEMRQRTRGRSDNNGQNSTKNGLECQSGWNLSAFDALMQDRELVKLLAAPWSVFKTAAVRACKDALRVLAAATPPSLPEFVPWSLNDSSTDNAVAANHGCGSKKNRGSSHPAEDLLRRAYAFSGNGLPGGVGRKGGVPGIGTMRRGVPTWQDKRGLLSRGGNRWISTRAQEDYSEEEQETNEEKQEAGEILEEKNAGDEATWLRRVVPWKGRTKALALSRARQAWGLLITGNGNDTFESL